MPGRRSTGSRLTWSVAGGCAVLVALLATVLVAVATAGHGKGDTPRALTAEETNRFALTRFRNYEAAGRAVTVTVPGAAGRVVLTGVVDYRRRFGYAVVRGEGRSASGNGLVEWSAGTVLVRPTVDVPAQPPVPAPTDGWLGRPLQNAGSALDSALAVTLGLGEDRPDNAALLAQNGATWLRRDEVAGHPVDVVAGPGARERPGSAGSVRYWLGGDGTMYRVEAAVASETQPVVVDLGAPGPAAVEPLPGLATPR